MALIVIEQAEGEFFTVQKVRSFLRAELLPVPEPEGGYSAELVAENEDIKELVEDAVAKVEVDTHLALMVRTYECVLNCFSSRVIELEKPPVHEVESIKYIDPDGAEKTLSDEVYSVSLSSKPAKIYLNEGQSWPATSSKPESVRIRYKAGFKQTFGEDEEVIERLRLPKPLRRAVQFLIGHWYVNREAEVVGVSGQISVPKTYDFAVMPYRVEL